MAVETISARDVRSTRRFAGAVMRLPRFIRAVIQSHHAATEINALSDHYLRDIGLDRPDISELVKRKIARDTLLDTGWPRRDNSHRR